jgi:hypothetical protein
MFSFRARARSRDARDASSRFFARNTIFGVVGRQNGH